MLLVTSIASDAKVWILIGNKQGCPLGLDGPCDPLWLDQPGFSSSMKQIVAHLVVNSFIVDSALLTSLILTSCVTRFLEIAFSLIQGILGTFSLT